MAHQSLLTRKSHLSPLRGAAPTIKARLAVAGIRQMVAFCRENAIMAFYPDVEPKIADWAVSKLRPQWAEAFSKIGPVAPYADKVARHGVRVLELRDKLPATTGAAETSATLATPVEEDVVSALVNLGYQRAAVDKALQAVRGKSALSFELLFREALGSLSK